VGHHIYMVRGGQARALRRGHSANRSCIVTHS
jgi:hypothetical protein